MDSDSAMLLNHNLCPRAMCTCLVHLRKLTCVKLAERCREEDISYRDFISITQALLVR